MGEASVDTGPARLQKANLSSWNFLRSRLAKALENDDLATVARIEALMREISLAVERER